MTYTERQELNELSKKVFGTSSRWQKIVNNGVAEPYEREHEVMVPNSRGGVTKKVFKHKKNVLRRYTVQEIRTLMEDILNNRKTTATTSVPSVQEIVSGDTVTLSDGSTATVTT